ncbi:hypothetical protein N7486_000678 [Penicillium sp. IBT 16267x]|nr:hypothetical protein N7486_000678 [Penicillium sp. IBT 16267x]
MGNQELFSKSALDEVSESLPDDTLGLETKEVSVSGFHDGKRPPPLKARLFAVALIACISFGSHWSSGVTSAMKSTIKKKMDIDNVQFALLEASEDFMATVLLLPSGILTDSVGGAKMIVYGNIVYTIGSILVAAAATVRSFRFMIGGRMILAFGDIATQIAQYKLFSSWFAPSNGFASTLGFELAIGKVGGFIGKSTANIIATVMFMNLFTNAATVVFWFFNKYSDRNFSGRRDNATNEQLTEKNKKFELQKVFELPWMFWAVMAFSLFQTSTASAFSTNVTELAEQRFDVSSIGAGWYSSLSEYAGCLLVPILGVFIDVLGHRASHGPSQLYSKAGTGASFGIYAIAMSFGPTSVIDGIRTTLWNQSVFGSAYSLKGTMNNAMSIILRIITGALQDADDDSYDRVVQVYLFMAAGSLVVGSALLIGSIVSLYLAPLQWTRQKRLTSGAEVIQTNKERALVTHAGRTRFISIGCFGALLEVIRFQDPRYWYLMGVIGH